MEELPQDFIRCVVAKKKLKLRRKGVFHLHTPMLSSRLFNGWGVPPMLAVFKTAYLLQTLRKANETTALEFIHPMRLIFPDQKSQTGILPGEMGGSTFAPTKFVDKVRAGFRAKRRDPTEPIILPFPVGYQEIGGGGRALYMIQELHDLYDIEIIGLGLPKEFVYGGLCIKSSTYVPTSRGVIQIGQAAPTDEKRTRELDGSLQVATQDGRRAASHSHNVGKKRPLHLRPRSGFELSAAASHPVWVLDRDLRLTYRNLQDLRVGDYVVRVHGSDVWAVEPAVLPQVSVPTSGPPRVPVRLPTEMTEDLALVLGCLTAEGCIDKERVRFGNTDKVYLDTYCEALTRVFGLDVCVYEAPQSSGKIFYEATVWSRTLSEFLIRLGAGGRSHEKEIPWAVLESPKSVVSTFLRGYYEGDGSICLKPSGAGSVVAYTASERLAEQLRVVLLNAGIDSSTYRPTKRSTVYKVTVRADLTEFQQFAGFLSEHKRERLAGLVARNKPRVQIPYVREVIGELRRAHPRCAWERRPATPDIADGAYTIKEAAAELRVDPGVLYNAASDGSLQYERVGGHERYEVDAAELRRYGAEVGLPVRSGRSWPTFHKKHVTLEVLAAADLTLVGEHDPEMLERLQRILRGDLRFDAVKSITPVDDLVSMSDFTIPGPDSYVSGGILSHNSWSGSSVSLRMLENLFLTDHSQLEKLLQWIGNKLSTGLGWPSCKLGLTEFKMADDMSRMSFMGQLVSGGNLARDTMLQYLDTTYKDEVESMKSEVELEGELHLARQLASARAQAQAQVLLTQQQDAYRSVQQPAQGGDPQAQGPPQAAQGGGPQAAQGAPPQAQGPPQVQGAAPPPGAEPSAMSPTGEAGPEEMAQYLFTLPPEGRRQLLAQISEAYPQEYLQRLAQAGAQLRSQGAGAAPPSPAALPPPADVAQDIAAIQDPSERREHLQQVAQGAPPEYVQQLAQAGEALRDPTAVVASLALLPPGQQNEQLARLQQTMEPARFREVLQVLSQQAPSSAQPTPGQPSTTDIEQVVSSLAEMEPAERETALESIRASEPPEVLQAVETRLRAIDGTEGLHQRAQAHARKLTQLSLNDRESALVQLTAENPVLAAEVRRYLSSGSDQAVMQPLPDKLPPRRGPARSLI
mgnify:CR=1 FL=1